MEYPHIFTAFQETHKLIKDDKIRKLECHNLGNLGLCKSLCK